MPKKTPSKPDFQILTEEDRVALASLVPDDENANQHPEENVAQLMEALRLYGQPVRLIARKSDRLVFDGNGRITAMQNLGWKSARIQWVEGSTEACRGYSIAANDTPRTSRWDEPALADQLQEFAATGALELTTWTPERYEALLEDVHQPDLATGEPLPRGRGGALATCPKCGHAFQLGADKDEKPKPKRRTA